MILNVRYGETLLNGDNQPMSTPISTNELSPLDQIRLAEGEVTRKIVSAREASEHAINEARMQAVLIKKQSREAGESAGQIRYKAIVSETEEEAQATIAHARSQAIDLQRRGQARLDAAIREATGIILGLKGREVNHEP
jgi:vacuolar-type H+-ATPase subunit H